MSFETAKKYVDLILSGDKGFAEYLNYEETAGCVFDFIGGEPLLEIDLIYDICCYIEERMLELNHPWLMTHRFSICSNGVLYFHPKVQKFINQFKNRLSITITIDGNKELHDSCRVFPDGSPSYDLAIAAALDCQKRQGNVGSKITLAPSNLTYLNPAINNLVSLGYTDIFANCVFEEGWTNENATTLYKEMKTLADNLLNAEDKQDVSVTLYDKSAFCPMSPEDNQNCCGGTGGMLSCDPDGWLYPCIRYMESSLGNDAPPLKIGHVDIGIGTCKKETECIDCLKKITRRSQSTDECWNCPIAKGCVWCSGYNYQVFKTADKRATFICCMHKARALANVYYWNKYYIKNNIPERMKMYCPKEWALEIIDEDEYNMLCQLAEREIENEY